MRAYKTYNPNILLGLLSTAYDQKISTKTDILRGGFHFGRTWPVL